MRSVALALVLALAACAPTYQSFDAPTHTPLLNKESIVAVDGKELPLKRWLPKGKPKAVILALHGFNDYSHAFSGTGTYLSKRGYAVYAYDQRGFGAAPQPGIWAGEENLRRDVVTGVALLNARYPDTPVYLLGESMGGAVAMLAVAEHPMLNVDGVILQAPAVWGGRAMPLLYRGVLWGAAHSVPWMKLTGRNLKILATNNMEVLRQMGRDPKIIKATRIDAIYGVVTLMSHASEESTHIVPQALLLHGGKDQVIPRKAIERAAKQMPDVTTVYYENGYHMLTRDLQGDAVLADIAKWLEHDTRRQRHTP